MRTTSCFLLAALALCLVGSTLFANAQKEPAGSKKAGDVRSDSDISRLPIMPTRKGCNTTVPAIADLSGYYIGTIKVPGYSDAIYKANLHIDKGEFTLSTLTDEGDLKVTGTLSAVKSCAYTGAAFRILDAEGGTPNFALIEGRTFSLKAIPGKGLALTEVAGQSVDVALYCDCSKCKNPKKCDCCGG